MLSEGVKRAVALLSTVILFGAAYYGSYLPLRKSQAFIAVLRNTGNLRTINDFQNAYRAVFAMPSPIGQEELVRNLASTAVNVVSTAPNPGVVEFMVQFVEDSFRPIMQSGKGMSFSQNLYVLGNLHQAAFIKTQDPRYLEAAKGYYLQGVSRAPRRPQFLYGLLDVYRLGGNTAGVLEAQGKILALWPDDARVVDAVQKYVDAQATTTKKAKAN